MYGIEAINANNGWAISVVGITIVFSGLVMLSLVISQLHKVLALWEDPSRIKKIFSRKPDAKAQLSEEINEKEILGVGQKQVIKQFALLVRTMDDHFSLPKLLHLAKITGLQDPYGHLNILIEWKIVVPDNDGFFTWDKTTFESAVSE